MAGTKFALAGIRDDDLERKRGETTRRAAVQVCVLSSSPFLLYFLTRPHLALPFYSILAYPTLPYLPDVWRYSRLTFLWPGAPGSPLMSANERTSHYRYASGAPPRGLGRCEDGGTRRVNSPPRECDRAGGQADEPARVLVMRSVCVVLSHGVRRSSSWGTMTTRVSAIVRTSQSVCTRRVAIVLDDSSRAARRGERMGMCFSALSASPPTR
ncbi:hypothetical protein K438DRAFT_1968087 [Mycena galopus ATCC 62051]|nr:hypothetical protein K438DRAFT_1968087 [Mycena galopus ATCC 62051]